MNPAYYTGIHVLSEIVYQKPGIASFPIFKDLPLKASFSWGKDAPSLAYKGASKKELNEKRNRFFDQLSLPKKHVFIYQKSSTQNQLFVVDDSLFEDETEIFTGSNILFTKSKKVALIAGSADCPCAIIYVKNDSQTILGVIHSGRKQTDARLPEKAIDYLKANKIDPKDIFIAISPGISKNHYFIPKNAENEMLPHTDFWGKYKEEKTVNQENRIYLDLHGYIINQFIAAGVLPEHIEIYDIDTYTAAEKGESFSHRYATVTKQPEKDGRFLIAASLG